VILTMASDLEQRLAEEEKAKNLIGIPECLADITRRVVPHGAGRVDNSAALSIALTGEIQPKAFGMVVYFRASGSVLKRPGYGQVGFVRQMKIKSNPGGTDHFSVMPVTAKHNLRRLSNFEAIETEILIDREIKASFGFRDLNWTPGTSTSDSVSLCSENEECVRPSQWTFGLDISRGDLLTHPQDGITSERHTFELVRESFTFEVGQKVGIAVVFSYASKPTNKTVSGVGEDSVRINDTELEAIYGLPDVVNIYTGKVIYVGSEHIEYDINTFTGCSGATVFLLDLDQPSSVQSCDFGKAVAVHAGSHPFLANRNLGFKIRKAFD
jgi:hypothetical protein